MQSLENKVLNRIYGHGRGWCFTQKTFADLGSPQSIRTALFRLMKKKTIRRLAKGLYDYPQKDPQLGMLSPSPEAIARALVHRDAIRIQPTGAYAANLLGLSEQVPARIVFLTDGPPRRVRFGKQEIVLRRTTPRNMATAGRVSGTVIQALRYIGKARVTPVHRIRLAHRLKSKEKEQLRKDRLQAPGWMRPILEQISEKLHA